MHIIIDSGYVLIFFLSASKGKLPAKGILPKLYITLKLSLSQPAHVVKGVHSCLNKDGKFIFEVQYLVDLVDKFQFDFMYHEHLYYYTITSLSHLLSKHGLKIIDVERVPIHSGSLRVIATKNTSINANSKVNELIQLEYNYIVKELIITCGLTVIKNILLIGL